MKKSGGKGLLDQEAMRKLRGRIANAVNEGKDVSVTYNHDDVRKQVEEVSSSSFNLAALCSCIIDPTESWREEGKEGQLQISPSDLRYVASNFFWLLVHPR